MKADQILTARFGEYGLETVTMKDVEPYLNSEVFKFTKDDELRLKNGQVEFKGYKLYKKKVR